MIRENWNCLEKKNLYFIIKGVDMRYIGYLEFLYLMCKIWKLRKMNLCIIKGKQLSN